MKILQGVLAACFGLATIFIFILFVLLLFAMLSGEGGVNIVVPGLGLVIWGALVLVGLFIAGAFTLSVTILLARNLFRKSPLK